MPVSHRQLIAVTAACCTVTVGLAPSSRADTHTPTTPLPRAAAEAGADVDAVASFVHEVQWEEAMQSLRDDIGAYVTAVIAAEYRAAQEAAAAARRRTVTPRATAPPPSPAVRGACSHSDAWWQGVATQEEGGKNDPYYGYFGKIDGAWAGLSWSEQVTRANALLQAAGCRERLSQGGPWADISVNRAYAVAPGG